MQMSKTGHPVKNAVLFDGGRRIMIKPFFIGLAGGSGSGKTTLAQALHSHLGIEKSTIFCLDWYYNDIQQQPKSADGSVNFDHPHALDQQLLITHLDLLKQGKELNVPIYDFGTHQRLKLTKRISTCQLVLIEGLHVLSLEPVRQILDLKVYIDLPDDVRFIRRLLRDQAERGRSLETVINQYLTTTRPMHLEWVAPSRQFADVVVSAQDPVSKMAQMVLGRIQPGWLA